VLSPSAHERTPRTWLLLLALGLVVVVPYVGVIDGEWVYDDTLLIANNSYVHELSHWRRWFVTEFWDVDVRTRLPGHLVFWRPWITMSYALDWAIGGGSTVVFHLTNLILHGVATAWSFLALRRWVGSTSVAFLATALLAMHPFRAESVAWISGRPDLWLMVGVLAALQGVALRLNGHRWGLAVEIAGTLVAYLSKEHAVVLPALVAVEAWVATQTAPTGRWWRLLAWTALPQALVAAAYLGFRQHFLPMDLGASTPWPWWAHAGIVLETLGRYTEILAWPADLTFGAALMFLRATRPELNGWYMVLGGVVTLAGIGLALWGLRRNRLLALGVLALAATVFPVSNAMHIGYSVLASPRLLYLPALPLTLIVALGFERVRGARRPFWRTWRTSLAAATGLILVWGSLSGLRAAAFQSKSRFWTAEAESTPEYYPAIEYFTRHSLDNRRPRLALRLAHMAFRDVRRTAARQHAPRMLAHALQAVLRLTPDLDQQSLRAIHRFIADARSGRTARIALPAHELAMTIPANSETARVFTATPLTRCLLVEAAARTDQWDLVRGEARRIVEEEPERAKPIAMQAAACHDFELARVAWEAYERTSAEATDEPFRAIGILQAHERQPGSIARPVVASAYIKMGAWRKAYWVLQPFLESPEGLDLEATKLVAQVAYCAGDEKGARGLLRTNLPSRARASLVARWNLHMQWVDAPLEPGERPIPDALAERLAP